MAFNDRIADSGGSASPKCVSKLHTGQYDINDDHQYNDQRNNQYRTLWWRVQQLVGIQCLSKWTSQRSDYNVFSNQCRGGISGGDYPQSRWYHRNRGHRPHSYARLRSYFAVGLLSITCLYPAVAKADGDVNPETNVIANPIATTTGQATNQAVQINQGGYSKQSFSPGHFCNSSTLTVSPFYIGSDVHPMYSRNQNFGIQATVSFPLDGKMVEQCKALAAKRLEKERLDYALVRALKCAELLKAGFMFHPDSQFSVVCSDVVPIALLPKSGEVSAP